MKKLIALAILLTVASSGKAADFGFSYPHPWIAGATVTVVTTSTAGRILKTASGYVCDRVPRLAPLRIVIRPVTKAEITYPVALKAGFSVNGKTVVSIPNFPLNAPIERTISGNPADDNIVCFAQTVSGNFSRRVPIGVPMR